MDPAVPLTFRYFQCSGPAHAFVLEENPMPSDKKSVILSSLSSTSGTSGTSKVYSPVSCIPIYCQDSRQPTRKSGFSTLKNSIITNFKRWQIERICSMHQTIAKKLMGLSTYHQNILTYSMIN